MFMAFDFVSSKRKNDAAISKQNAKVKRLVLTVFLIFSVF